MTRTTLCCLALLLTATASNVRAESDLGANAALRYWQAFAAMPEFNDDQLEAITDWQTVELDNEHAASVIAQSRTAIDALHAAAKLDACDWGLDLSQGFALPLPHVTKSRQLTRIACLSARADLAAGQNDAALRTLRAAAKLATDTGEPALLICQLVAVAGQSMVRDAIADGAHRLTVEQRAALIRDLPKLMPTPKLSDGMRAERDIAVPWLRGLSNNPAKLMAAMQGGDGGGPNLPDDNDGVKMIRKQVDLLESDYNELIAVADGPIDEIDKLTDQIVERAKRESRILTAIALPSLGSAGRVLQDSATKTSQLRAGLLYLDGGQAAADKIADPHGDGPLAIAVNDDSITLTSKLVGRDGQPVTTTIRTK